MKLALLLHLIKHLLLICNSWFSTMKRGHVCDPIRSYQWRITVFNKTLLEAFTILSSHSADNQTDPPYNIKWIYPKACHGRTWAVVTVWERCGPIVSSTIVLVKLSLIDCVIWRKWVFKAAVCFFVFFYSLDKLHTALSELCFSVNYVPNMMVWEHTFTPREYLTSHLEIRFTK